MNHIIINRGSVLNDMRNRAQWKQREYDNKWEKILPFYQLQEKYDFKSEDGRIKTYIPIKWMTVGVYDYRMEIEL